MKLKQVLQDAELKNNAEQFCVVETLNSFVLWKG
jgi:hypothetical protein